MAFGFFDGNKADASPESIKRKREMIARMMASSRAPRNIGEGLNSIGDSIASSILGYRADKAERANEAERASIMGGINFGGAPMASAGNPVATGSGATRAVAAPEQFAPLFAEKETKYGLPQGYLARTAQIESNFDPNAKNPNSSAGGIFQFIDGTARQYGLRNRFDPVEATAAAARLAADNRDFLARRLGRDPTAGELYLAHQQGAGGAAKLLANPDALASSVVGNAAARLNRGAGMTAGAFANQWINKFGTPVVRPGKGATPMPLQTASAGPQANDAQMQDGAGELQAGGSGLMAEPAVYRGQLNDVPSGDLMQRGPMPALPPGFDLSSLVMPAGQPADAMGQGIAENEEQTRIMEAQMAAEQGLPYAGNEPGQFNSMFSPDPMGGGLNPFVPRDMVQPEDAIAQAPTPMLPQMDRATFDAITGQMPPAPSMDRRNFDQITSTGAPLNPAFTGQQAGLAPSWGIGDPNAPPPVAQEVSGPAPGPFPTPPPRPANIAPPQSPFVPPAMRQPMSMDFGGENSGGAMQFIESEFARREGRPDPRTAMGAPGQIYNPFVQQPTQAPQMPAGGDPAAQAQARPQGGMITPDQFRAVMSSPFTSEADKRFVMDMWNQQRAMQQADADRARTDQQYTRLAKDLGLTEAEVRNPEVVKRRAEQRFREAPETFRNLTPSERLQNNIDPNDRRPYQISTRTGKVSGVGGTQIVNNMRTEGAIPPGYRAVRDPQGNVERIEPIPGSQQDRDIKEAEEKKGKSKIQDERYANVIFRSVADIDRNMKGSWFPTTGTIGQALSGVAGTNAHNVARAIDAIKANIGFERLNAMRAASPTGGALGGIAVKELELLTASAGNLEQSQSADQFRRNLERLRSDFEMVIHGRTFSPEERKRMAASEAAQADQGRARPNFIDQSAARPQPTPAQSSAALQNARKAIADGAPREAVMDRLRQAGIDPGGL